MPKVKYSSQKTTYFSVLADGQFHQSVTEGTEGAERREYETSDGTKGVKYELKAESITGVLGAVSVFSGNYGKNILIQFKKLEKDDEDVVISLSANNSFGEDFLKKLPNIDVEKEVTLSPYAFEDEKGKNRKGISIVQEDKKIASFYSKENKKTKKWDVINGYPEPEGDTKKFDADDWKSFFSDARKFMLKEFAKHPLFVEELVTSESEEVDKAEETYAKF